jgi:glycosyltransferase involved in cell wall biosynthesis
MKTMVLTPSLRRTGPVQGSFLLARHLQQCGEEVVFAVLDADVPSAVSLADEVESSGVAVHCFNMTGWRGIRHRHRVRAYLRENAIDAVVSDGLRPDLINGGLDVVRIGTVRGILQEHYALDHGWPLSRGITIVHVRALRRLDAIFAISAAIRDHLVGKGVDPGRIQVVNNFVDVDEIRKALATGPQLNDASIHVGYFGALIRRKRVDVAIRAVAKLVKECGHKALKLHIVGDGPLHEKLAGSVRDFSLEQQVAFHGYLRNPLDLMKDMNLVVLPSDSEGVPRCLMEALSLEKTCIASDIPGVRGLIEDGVTGYLFKRGDAEDMASVIDGVIREGRYLPKENLHRHMLRNHDVTTGAEAMLSRVRELVGRRAVSH